MSRSVLQVIENPDGSVPPPAPSGGFVLPEDQKEVGTVQLYNYCPAILLYYYTTILLSGVKYLLKKDVNIKNI